MRSNQIKKLHSRNVSTVHDFFSLMPKIHIQLQCPYEFGTKECVCVCVGGGGGVWWRWWLGHVPGFFLLAWQLEPKTLVLFYIFPLTTILHPIFVKVPRINSQFWS